MTQEQFNEQIESWKKEYREDSAYCGEGQTVTDVRLAAGQVLEKATKDISTKVDCGWNSVKKLMPEDEEWVITCCNDLGTPTSLAICRFHCGEWLDQNDEETNVEYWIPLPKNLSNRY